MKVAILSSYFWPAYKAGGPARSITNLAKYLAREHEVLVVTSDRDLGDPNPFAGVGPSELVDGAEVEYVDLRSIRSYSRALKVIAAFSPDVLILNSIWDLNLSFIPAALKAMGFLRAGTTVLMPRGELEPGALALKAKKKRAVAGLVRRVYTCATDVVAGTSEAEMENAKRWFPGKRHVVVSNIPDELSFAEARRDLSRFRLLFLGRIHPTKGLLELVTALQHSAERMELTVAGPVTDEAYAEMCLRAEEDLPGYVEVSWAGPVPRGEIPDLLAGHDLLVTLTAGENFGHTIAEALQSGCPVLATDRTPWTHVLEDGAGYVCRDRDDPEMVLDSILTACMEWRKDAAQMRIRARDGYDEWLVGGEFDVVERAVQVHRG